MTFSWFGRQMESANVNGTAITYKYNADGLRTEKKVGSTVSKYEYTGDKLFYEKRGDLEFHYRYDAFGNVASITRVKADGTSFSLYTVCNSRGDVEELRRSTGELFARYVYDSWGNVLHIYDVNGAEITSTANFAVQNPFRYRGYYYDNETGLYYLQSRYYDPVTHRFLNADDINYIGADGSPLSYNLFSYCVNNPVNRMDINGNWSGWATAGVIVGAVLCIAAVTILTCGVGTATLVGAVAVGAAKGALVGAAIGTVAGAGIGYAATGTLEGAATGAAIGFGAGAVVGAVVGGSAGANSWYNARALEFTNSGSSEVILGRSGTYEQVAQSKGSTYFHASNARWNKVHDMFGVGDKGMWKINKAFLNQQIAAGRSFVLSNNPLIDRGCYLAKEVSYLVSKGIGFTIL